MRLVLSTREAPLLLRYVQAPEIFPSWYCVITAVEMSVRYLAVDLAEIVWGSV